MSTEAVRELCTNIGAFLILAVIVVALIILCFYIGKQYKARQEFLKTLDEHDKAVIHDYIESMCIPLFEKKDKRK